MSSSAQSRIAVVTGGSRGIGAAICDRLAKDGVAVNVVFHSAESAARQVVDRITRSGGTAVMRRADVSDEAQVDALVEQIWDEHGGIHVLVNNAAVIDDQLVTRMKTSQWEHVLRVNLSAPFLMSRAVIPIMLDQKWGRIINISSNSARTPGPGQAAYAAAKGGLEALTRSLAVELSHKGIRANTVAPGKIRTDMTASLDEQLGDDDASSGRWGQPEDIAGIVNFLASEEADYIQGQLITADGGRSVLRPGKRNGKGRDAGMLRDRVSNAA